MEKKKDQFISEMRELLLDYHRYISALEQKTEINEFFFDRKMEKLADKYLDNDDDDQDEDSESEDNEKEKLSIEKFLIELMKELVPKKRDRFTKLV